MQWGSEHQEAWGDCHTHSVEQCLLVMIVNAHVGKDRYWILSHFTVLQAMESLVGHGNEARNWLYSLCVANILCMLILPDHSMKKDTSATRE